MAAVDVNRPSQLSPLAALQVLRPNIGCGKWLDNDVVFLFEAVRGLLGVAASQVQGLAQLYLAGPPILLHPSATLVRGTAEAGGTAIWLLEPWITALAGNSVLYEDDWKRQSVTVLARTEVKHLDELDSRRRRRETSPGFPNSGQDTELQDFKDLLLQRHSSCDVKVSGGRKKWAVHGESAPDLTYRVTAATEYAYGQRHRGEGLNPYPTLSGYAHAGLDVVFAQAPATGRPDMSTLFEAHEDDAHKVASVAMRLLAATYEIIALALGVDLAGLHAWEREVDVFMLDS